MIKKIISFITILFCITSVNASETTKPLVYIDVEYIVSNSLASQQVKKMIQVEVDRFQLDMQEKQQIISKQEQDLKAKAQVLSADVIQEEQKKILAQFKAFESELAEKKSSLDKKYNDFLLEIQTHIQKIVVEIAEENNYPVVVAKSSLIYALQSLDISDEVVLALNKRVPELDFNG
jgi:Skp family chaperone for outer membrane proteins